MNETKEQTVQDTTAPYTVRLRDQVRNLGWPLHTGSRFEGRCPDCNCERLIPQQRCGLEKQAGEKEGRRRETKWRPSLRETLAQGTALPGLGAGAQLLIHVGISEPNSAAGELCRINCPVGQPARS